MRDTAVALWRPATLWLLFLGPFFFLAYGVANWSASLSPGLPSLFLPWERDIPFVPEMIVPYLSMDLLFAGALFLCRDVREIRLHAARIVFATLLSVSIFVLYPMQYGFERPATTGFYGPLFDLLYLFDGPFNQAPSLHVSLAIIVWAVYARRSRGIVRRLVDFWFLLVIASILFTWQHHLIDVPAGALVGYAALRLFPDSAARSEASGDGWIAARYGAVALVPWAAAFVVPAAAPVLLWTAMSLAVIAAIYAGLGPGIFGKSAGRLGFFTRLLLVPYFAGAGLAMRWFSRSAAPWSRISPSLLLGRRLGEREARDAVAGGVVAVLDLTAEFPEAEAFLRIPYLNLPVLDLAAPTLGQLAAGVEFIEAHAPAGPVYVHCAVGFSRSAVVAAAWLLHTGQAADVGEAEAGIRRHRAAIVFSGRHRRLLEDYRRGVVSGRAAGDARGIIASGTFPVNVHRHE